MKPSRWMEVSTHTYTHTHTHTHTPKFQSKAVVYYTSLFFNYFFETAPHSSLRKLPNCSRDLSCSHHKNRQNNNQHFKLLFFKTTLNQIYTCRKLNFPYIKSIIHIQTMVFYMFFTRYSESISSHHVTAFFKSVLKKGPYFKLPSQ